MHLSMRERNVSIQSILLLHLLAEEMFLQERLLPLFQHQNLSIFWHNLKDFCRWSASRLR